MHSSVVLIGFMATGKDTVGQELARRTGRVFVSTDRFVEIMTGKTIANIFAREGENAFRGYERSALSAVVSIPNAIIATGGGIVARPENRALLKECITVHLTAPLEVIQERLRTCRTRPLAMDKEQIVALFRDREGMYDHANVTVDTAAGSPGETAQLIIRDLHVNLYEESVKPETVTVNTPGTSCPVLCGSRVLADPAAFTTTIKKADQVCVVTNPLVGALYLDLLHQVLRQCKATIDEVIVPDNEQAKTLNSASMIYDRLMTKGFSRSGILIALGGGVVSDLTGFVAATYKRGVRCMFVPTTLLGQVDAAIGGKNGVNHEQGKNMVGTFYQPDQVIIDVATLRTLPEKEFQNGMTEIIKYAITQDKELVTILEQQKHAIQDRDLAMLAKLIIRCVKIKAAIVAQDERETRGKRQQLNFGHTIGHAIETATGYQITHGQAVAMGMALEAKASVEHGYLDAQQYDRLLKLITSYGLPYNLPRNLNMKTIQRLIDQDKKVRGDRIIMPVLRDIGAVLIKEVSCKTFL